MRFDGVLRRLHVDSTEVLRSMRIGVSGVDALTKATVMAAHDNSKLTFYPKRSNR